jgi:hypothetical protein
MCLRGLNGRHWESLSTAEESELEHLIDAEIRGAGERAAALRPEIAP